jgi:hypothetical protein
MANPAQIGAGHIHGLNAADLDCNLSGYVTPRMESLRLTHVAEIDKIKGLTGGNTTAMIAQDEKLECTFEVIPQGSSFANAILSAGLPAILAAFTIPGLQVIVMGAWSDALNVTGGGVLGNPWIYEGGGSVNGFVDQKWTVSLPLHRYVAIASVTLIT